MRPTFPRRVSFVAALVATSALAACLTGASSPKKKRNEPPAPKIEETVGDLAVIRSKTDTKLEGVGLVVGLDDTGVDPPMSWYRQKLVDEMRKAGVENANKILKDPRVSLVIVRVTVPAGASPSDRLDASIELTPGSGTKSLAGGYLLSCRLRELLVLGGTPKEGPEAATAQGPVMTGSLDKPDDVRSGRVLGAARVRKELPFQLILKENYKSVRVAYNVEGVINQRFPQTQGVEQKGSATAKTDQFLVLKLPKIYHQNQDRFFRVVKLLHVMDTPALREKRLETWGRELLEPSKAGIAALRLEGLGVTGTDALKKGLASPNSQVRFLSAEALAYLDDPAGAEILRQTVRDEPGFRPEALAALAAMDQPASHVALRKLLDEPDVETRYGAFNALRVLSPDDPFLGQVRVLDEPKPDPTEETSDSMAMAISRAAHKKRTEDPFSLYVVDCEGPPMIHVSRTRRCEVVVFGRNQRMLTPIVLGTGPFLLNASDGDQSVQVSKIVPSRFGDHDAKVQASLDLGDVVRQAANIGAGYPEIVSILQAAHRQKNLAGPLVVDAVPGSSPEYLQAAILGKDIAKSKKDDALKKASLEEPAPKKQKKLLDRFRGLFNRDHD
jgi:flagellar basal body P-ring protein FlgI